MDTIIVTNNTILNVSQEAPSIVQVTPQEVIITDIQVSTQETTFVDIGQGIQGARGESLTFEDLTDSQKLELRGDVGDTSTNYTNIFLNSLLS